MHLVSHLRIFTPELIRSWSGGMCFAFIVSESLPLSHHVWSLAVQLFTTPQVPEDISEAISHNLDSEKTPVVTTPLPRLLLNIAKLTDGEKMGVETLTSFKCLLWHGHVAHPHSVKILSRFILAFTYSLFILFL